MKILISLWFVWYLGFLPINFVPLPAPLTVQTSQLMSIDLLVRKLFQCDGYQSQPSFCPVPTAP